MIILYIVLGLVAVVIVFFTWFFVVFLKIPKIEVPVGASKEERVACIDAWLTKLHEQHKFNGAILIANNNEPLLAKAYGFTNAHMNEELTINSSFRLASVSKQFTAAGIMLLKEKKLLDYEDEAGKYIPELPYEGVTIRHLLNHTSGIPDIYLSLAKLHKDTIEVLSNEKAVQLLIDAAKPFQSAPNEKFKYANTNYILLAHIIEIISGKSFEAFMQDELFRPLGMTNTRVWNLLSKEATFAHKTSSFKHFRGKNIKEMPPTFIDGVAGDGAVFSSIQDFLIWDKFWYENDLLSEENLAEAFVKPTLNNGKTSDYGFGWIVAGELVWHNGAWLGANTVIMRNVAGKTSLVLLDNSSNIYFSNIVKRLNK